MFQMTANWEGAEYTTVSVKVDFDNISILNSLIASYNYFDLQ